MSENEHYIEEVESTRRYRGLITISHEKIRECERLAEKSDDKAQGYFYGAVLLLFMVAGFTGFAFTVHGSNRVALFILAALAGGAGLVFAGHWLKARGEGAMHRGARLRELVDVEFYAERLCAMTEQLEDLTVELDRPTPNLDRLLNEEDEAWTQRDATS